MSKYPIDIVVNVYNEEKNIRDFCESLLKQSFTDFRLIIADDGSTDDTVQIMDEYSDRLCIDLLRLPHLGLRGARAKAVEIVQADFFIIFDADQIIEESAVERFIQAFDEEDIGAVTGRKISIGNTWSERGNRVVTEITFNALNSGENADQLSGGCFACRTEPLRKLGGLSGFDKHAEDLELTWRLQKAGWRTVARNDIIVYHQDPIGIWEMIKWGWRMGRLAVHTRMKHKEKFFRWHFFVRFSPIILLLIALFSPTLALIGCIMNILLFLFKSRAVDASLQDKLFGWVTFMFKSFGWNFAFGKVFVEYFWYRWRNGENNQMLSEGRVN